MASTLKDFLEKALDDSCGKNHKKKKKKIDEGRWQGMESVIDDFTRYLIGDRKSALNGLKRSMNQDLGFNLSQMDSKEYNDLYADLFSDISKAIKKNLFWK